MLVTQEVVIHDTLRANKVRIVQNRRTTIKKVIEDDVPLIVVNVDENHVSEELDIYVSAITTKVRSSVSNMPIKKNKQKPSVEEVMKH